MCVIFYFFNKTNGQTQLKKSMTKKKNGESTCVLLLDKHARDRRELDHKPATVTIWNTVPHLQCRLRLVPVVGHALPLDHATSTFYLSLDH
jgi:hypothetical protein